MLWRRKYDTFKEYLLSVLSVRWMSRIIKIFRYLSTVWTNTLFNYYIIDRLSLTKPLWHMVLYPGVRAIYSWEDENNFTGFELWSLPKESGSTCRMTLPNESRQACAMSCLEAVCSTNYGLDNKSFKMRSCLFNPAFLGKHISIHLQENQ